MNSMSLSFNTNKSKTDTQKLYPSNQTISNLPIENDEEEIKNNNDDCFKRFGLISSSKTQIEGNQSIQLVEEINAITALIIYNTYSKKKPIHNNIDPFDSIYSCLIDQYSQSNRLNNYLRHRFFTLPNVNQFKAFQQTE